MGVLVPDGFPLSSLSNDAERLVVEALVERPTDSWVVLPSVELTNSDRDHELDVVIAHPRDGVAVIEVKGHAPSVRDGLWYHGAERMVPQPTTQSRNNAYTLRDLLRSGHPTWQHLHVEHAVAFPNTRRISGSLPPGIDRDQVWTSEDLEDPLDAVDRLVALRTRSVALGDEGVRRVVSMLRPGCDFEVDDEVRARLARARLDDVCRIHVDALAGLDANRRVCVTGAAGTGKTRLALRWARRALLAERRVLVSCFNVPLADRLTESFVAQDGLVVGPFLDLALNLDGMPPLDRPADADADWWRTVGIPHIEGHWSEVTARFDTIVIDEAQDFEPQWIQLLEGLLAADGQDRLLMVADEAQAVYRRGFEPPNADDGWVRCRLTANCRNSFAIAALLQRHFAGAVAPVGGPDSEALRILGADGLDDIVDQVGDVLDDLEDRGHGAQRILVATCTSAVRDRLCEAYAFVRWEQREPMTVLCENVHRVKGLEFDHVILVVHDDQVDDSLIALGLSRAVMSATVIGPERRVAPLR